MAHHCYPWLVVLALMPAIAASAQSAEDERTPRTDLYGDPLPAGAIARLGTMRLRQDLVYGSRLPTFSPDGKWMATGSYRALFLWELATGRLIWRITEDYHLDHVVFSRDGKWLARPRKDAVALLDPATGHERKRIGTQALVAAFSPDGTCLATAGARATPIALWNVTGGKTLWQVTGPEGSPVQLQFSADGRTLLSFDFDAEDKVRLSRRDAVTGTLQSVLTMAPRCQRTMALSPDGRTLAVVSASDEPVQLWDAVTGKRRGVLRGERSAGRHGLAFSADSRILATDWFELQETEATISLWNTATGERLRRFRIPREATGLLTFALDGRTLLVDGTLATFYLLDTTTGKRRLQWPAHEGAIHALAFTPAGTELLSGSEDGTIRVWVAATGQVVGTLPGHPGGVKGLAVTPDGRAVLSGGLDEQLHLNDRQTGKELRRLDLVPVEQKFPDPGPEGRYEPCVGLSRDGRIAVAHIGTAGPAPLVHVWDLTTGQRLVERPDHTGASFGAFSPDARIMASFRNVYGPATQAQNAIAKQDAEPEIIGTQLLLQEVATGRTLGAIPLPDHNGYDTAFSPDGRTIMTSSFRRKTDASGSEAVGPTLHLWELATGTERLTIPASREGDPLDYQRIAFTCDGATLATARQDRTIVLRDMATGRELLRLTGYVSAVRSLAFAPDGRFLASGHADSSILVWDVASQTGRLRQRATVLATKDLEQYWTDLASSDARRAHVAVWALAGSPGATLPFLNRRLQPVSTIAAERLQQLIADLDSPQFKKREAGFWALADLGEQADRALTDALKVGPKAETRKRIESLLARPRFARPPESRRALRAIEVLQRIGTAEAQVILRRLAGGDPEATVTQQAKLALES